MNATKPLSGEGLEKLEAMEKAATPGPWHTEYTGISGYVYPEKGTWICTSPIPVWAAVDGTGKETNGYKDPAFIVALRNAAPALFEMARRAKGAESALAAAQARIAELEAQHAALLDQNADLVEGITSAQARIAELEADKWQPIETAPKDGSEILACYVSDMSNTTYGPFTIRWSHRDSDWESSWDGNHVVESQSDFGTEYIEPRLITHWQPLPAPPRPAQENTK